CAQKAPSTPPNKIARKPFFDPIAFLKEKFTHPPVHPLFTSSPCKSSAFSNGHCRILRVQIRNATPPSAISASPHFLAGPVCQKSHAHPTIVSNAGSG